MKKDLNKTAGIKLFISRVVVYGILLFLSFLCLAAGHGYCITDHGFIDSSHQCVADPVIEKIR